MLYFTLFIFLAIQFYQLSSNLIKNKNLYILNVIALYLLFYTAILTKPTSIVLLLPLIYLFISLKKNLFFEIFLGFFMFVNIFIDNIFF